MAVEVVRDVGATGGAEPFRRWTCRHGSARLRERLDAERVGGMLVTSLANIRYLSGFSGSAADAPRHGAALSCSSPTGATRTRPRREMATAGVDVELAVVNSTGQIKTIETATRNLAWIASGSRPNP